MALTLSDIRAAIKAQLVANLDRETNVYAEGEGDVFPSVTIELQDSDPIDYWLTMNGPTGNGVAEVRFDLVVDVGMTDRKSAVRRLDDYLSVGTGNGSSIIDALRADVTLGGVVETVHISGVSQYDATNVTAVLPLQVVCRKQGAN